jgi:hypothetical protein
MDNKSKGNDHWLGNKLSLSITQMKSSSDKSFDLANLNCTPFRKINRTWNNGSQRTGLEPAGTKKGTWVCGAHKSRTLEPDPLTFTGICDKIMKYFRGWTIASYELNNCVLVNLMPYKIYRCSRFYLWFPNIKPEDPCCPPKKIILKYFHGASQHSVKLGQDRFHKMHHDNLP